MALANKTTTLAPETVLEESKHGLFHQPIAVWAVFFASITAFMGMGLVNPVLPTIADNLEASKSEVTLLFTSYNAVMAFAMLITGAISSRIGQKGTLMLGIAVIALVAGFAAQADSIWTLVALRGGWGLGNALFVATALAAIVSLSSGGTAKAIILYEAAVGLGISIGPLLGGTLGSITWRAPFMGVATIMVIAFLVLLFLMPKPVATTTAPRQKISLLAPFQAMKHRSLLTLGIVAAFYNVGFFTIMAYAPFVMKLPAQGLGFVFLGWGMLLAITSVLTAPKLKQWLGTIKAMVLMLLLFAVLLLLMGIFTETPAVVIVCVILAGAVLGNNNTLITTAVMDAAPVERSTASAAYSFLRFLGAAIAPFMAGKLAEIFNANLPFYVGSGFVLLSVVIIGVNLKHIRHIDTIDSGH
ncbi:MULTISPECIES: MFS transporter [unclassified Exiguobacterium]|uniref:MFS transporter n=1 Tax=unclassified Exiguobacterium TaxID=2644629 RepID=UPI001BEB59AB|nr:MULTISPECIES: MFS transporter [unclassified Exiguobacterium]